MQKNPTVFPKKMAHFLIDGPAGALELKTNEGHAFSSTVAIICHPNPLQEGTMDNKVVHTAARAFEQLEAHTVRFNYRGVGKSEGQYGEVEGECDDFRAVIEWVKNALPEANLWFAGFSFGAYIAAKVAMQYKPSALLSIAPAVHLMDYHPLKVDCPWYVIRAMADELVDPAAISAWINASQSNIECIDFPECSHFFHGQLVKLRQTIEEVFKNTN